MVFIVTGFPRSANTFFSFLLKKGIKDIEYHYIAREFTKINDLSKFVRSNIRKNKICVLGHNHLNKFMEVRISLRYDIPIIFLFRNPLDSICSHLVLYESKSYHEDNCFRLKYVIKRCLGYSLFFWVGMLFKIRKRKHVIVTFDQLISNTEDTLTQIANRLSIDIAFNEEDIQEYFQSKFQKHAENLQRKKHAEEGYKIYLSPFQKIVINTLCMPLYKIMRVFAIGHRVK